MTAHRLTSEADLAALYPQPSALVIARAIGHLDVHCRSFLALSPVHDAGRPNPGRAGPARKQPFGLPA